MISTVPRSEPNRRSATSSAVCWDAFMTSLSSCTDSCATQEIGCPWVGTGRAPEHSPDTGGGHVQQTHPQGPPDRGPRRGLNLNLPATRVRVDRTVEQAGAGEYDGLLVPGGFINPDLLRQSAPARGLVREFVESGKPVVTLCHGPWVLASAGVLQGRTVTSWAGIRDDVVNAGATWLDQEVVRDGNLTTSRGPQDMAAFIPAMLDAFAAGPRRRDDLGHGSWVRPAAEQPAGPRDSSDAMVAEAVDRRRGRDRPGCAGEADRPARRRTRSLDVCGGG